MLEHYFVKPDTIDAIRASWIAEPIEQYVAWLAGHGYRPRVILRRVPLLRQFGEFARDHGATQWSELPTHVEPYVKHWVKVHAKNAYQAKRWVANDARTPIEQLLSLMLPDFRGTGRRRTSQDPFLVQAPGFFVYLREERGLRELSLRHYGHYLHNLEAYLARINLLHLSELTPAILSAFVVESGRRLSPHSMTGLCSSLRVFLRYLYREQLINRDLGATVESPRRYQLADPAGCVHRADPAAPLGRRPLGPSGAEVGIGQRSQRPVRPHGRTAGDRGRRVLCRPGPRALWRYGMVGPDGGRVRSGNRCALVRDRSSRRHPDNCTGRHSGRRTGNCIKYRVRSKFRNSGSEVARHRP